MNPVEFVSEMRGGVELRNILTPKQIDEAQDILDVGHTYIARSLGRHYDDMSPEAVDRAAKLQAFLIVFVEHCNNPALLRALDAL